MNELPAAEVRPSVVRRTLRWFGRAGVGGLVAGIILGGSVLAGRCECRNRAVNYAEVVLPGAECTRLETSAFGCHSEIDSVVCRDGARKYICTYYYGTNVDKNGCTEIHTIR